MPSPELFFLGKLRKHREFLVSPNLSHLHRSYWDTWFNRCHTDNQLTPFLGGKKSSRKVWLFLTKQHQLTYIGLATHSEDLVGRDYPFLVFAIVSSEDCLQNQLTAIVSFFQKQASYFETWVTQGQMDHSWQTTWQTAQGCHHQLAHELVYYADKACVDGRDTKGHLQLLADDDVALHNNDLPAPVSVLMTHYQTEPCISNWYDLKSTKIVIHPNTLTCSLYHKIFG